MRAGSAALTAILLVSLLPSPAAWAWPPTYGAEFTFTSDKIQRVRIPGLGHIVDDPENTAARDALATAIHHRCEQTGDCVIQVLKDKFDLPIYRVQYKDGWWFQIAVDPAVVEIQTKPATATELTAMRSRIQTDIFDLAQAHGLTPSPNVGGGHIHIGATSAFEGESDLFRNFVADFSNHPAIATGALGGDLFNAPPVRELDEKQQRALAEALADYDAGKIKNYEELAKRIQKKVYYKTTQFEPACKYQAVCLTRIAGNEFPQAERTMEIRSIRAQRGVDDFLLECRLFEARMSHLKGLKTKIPFVADADTVLTVQQKVNQYYEYVTESGLEWKEYKNLLPPEWRNIIPKPRVKPPAVDAGPVAAAPRQNCVTRWLSGLGRALKW